MKINELLKRNVSEGPIALLMKQHREVDALFAKIEKAKGATKGKLVRELEDALAVHATIEEEIFYPGCMMPNSKELLQEAVEEHLSLKRLIADLMGTSQTSPRFDALVTVLKEYVRHHVKEEETQLFPKVKAKVSKAKLEEMGQQMEALAAKLEAKGNPRNAIPKETSAPAELR